jgi:hypothetical protein
MSDGHERLHKKFLLRQKQRRMRMMTQIAVLPVATAIALVSFLPGCTAKNNEGPGNEAMEQTYKVEPNPSIRITNPHGSVTIQGTDGSEVRMRAVKSATNAAQLKNISVTVTANPEDVLIKTSFLREKNMPVVATGETVDYTLSVPRAARIARLDVDDGKVSIEGIQGSNTPGNDVNSGDVRANLVNGDLAIRNCCGDLKVAIGNGSLHLAYGTCEGSRFAAEAQVLQGNIHLFITPGASFRVRGETTDGKITNNLATTNRPNGQSSRNIDMSLVSRPLCDVTLRVTSGDIVIGPTKPAR